MPEGSNTLDSAADKVLSAAESSTDPLGWLCTPQAYFAPWMRSASCSSVLG